MIERSNDNIRWIEPEWPAPSNVRAAATLRVGGASRAPFDSLNLGAHVDDDPRAVAENRRRLCAALAIPSEPVWLQQVHGTHVVDAHAHASPPVADASIARVAGQVCVVLTADCLPVLFCDQQGKNVGAAHAGWRGLAGGVLAATVRALDVDPAKLLAWLGPAIEQDAFEVGDEVREQFIALSADHAHAFTRNPRGRWQADLDALARHELRRLGVTAVFGGGLRCYADQERFFSYRRDRQTGRMATLIWLAG
jgi:YfiH family protein